MYKTIIIWKCTVCLTNKKQIILSDCSEVGSQAWSVQQNRHWKGALSKVNDLSAKVLAPLVSIHIHLIACLFLTHILNRISGTTNCYLPQSMLMVWKFIPWISLYKPFYLNSKPLKTFISTFPTFEKTFISKRSHWEACNL